MPWCPKCRFEYVPQLHVCPDCKVKLVAELPEEPAMEEPAYGEGEGFEQVLLCTVAGQMESDVMRSALAADGIPCRVLYAGILPELGYPSPAAGAPMSIYVNTRDLAAARKVWQGTD